MCFTAGFSTLALTTTRVGFYRTGWRGIPNLWVTTPGGVTRVEALSGVSTFHGCEDGFSIPRANMSVR